MLISNEIPTANLMAERLGGWRGLIAAFSRDSIRFLRRLHEAYGDAVLVGKGEQSCLFTFSSSHTHSVLSNPSLFHSYELEAIPFPFSRSESIRRLTTALALMNGEKHKQQRRLMAPAFHTLRIESYHNKIVSLVDRTISSWQVDDRIDVFQEMDTLSILFSLAILIGVESDQEGIRLGSLFEETMRDLFNPMSFLLPVEFPGFPFHRLLQNAKILEHDLLELIDERKSRGTDLGDAMSLLIAAKDEDGTKLTQDELVGQTVALFRGGSKTTASALTWTLFFLDQHPQVAKTLHNELTDRLHGNAPSLSDLEHLPYLEFVIKESMRLMPPVIWGIRYSSEEFELGERTFPEGQSIMYSAQIAHRNPDVFSDPDCFVPTRWEQHKPSAYEYFPFSAGPRLCLGASFAMLAMKITLAILLQRHLPRLADRSRVDRIGLIGSLPRNGMPMMLTQPNEIMRDAFVPKGNIREFYSRGTS